MLCQFNYREGSNDLETYEEVSENNVYRLPRKFPEGAVVVDVGAHIGFFAMTALAYGAAKVICYEPDPANFKLLQENLAPFEDRVELHQKAVWGITGKVPFRSWSDSEYTTCGHVLLNSSACPLIDCVSLSEVLLSANNGKPVDFLKIDCEGGEYPSLYNCNCLHLVKKLAVETHCLNCSGSDIGTPGMEPQHEGLMELLKGVFPYTDEVKNLGDGPNGLIFASHEPGRKPAKILFFRFPYGYSEHPTVTDWMVKTAIECENDPRIEETKFGWLSDTPITMTRNHAVNVAQEEGVDLLVMVDSDMKPDCEPGAPEFWKTAFDFWWNHQGPCVIGAPYCGPPPYENVYVFQYNNLMNDKADTHFRLEQYNREHAASLTGTQRVAALPTGLILFDTEIFKIVKPPYFYYEMEDIRCMTKVGTEDVSMTRDLDHQGIPLYCTWDCWAGHWKRHLVRKPRPLDLKYVPAKIRQTMLREFRSGNVNLETRSAPVGMI